MSKLTKAQAKAHQQACDLLTKDVLTDDEREFVVTHWQASAKHINSIAGAFFTPPGLARDFAIEVTGSACRRVIDLCAGIGALSLYVYWQNRWPNDGAPEIVCVEKNPDYLAVGRKVLPEAAWVEADIFTLPDLGHFDFAISNPPFGATKRSGQAPRFTGQHFEYHVIDIAVDLADYGVFIIPQMSAPFRFSGQQHYERSEADHFKRFREQTGIDLQAGCGVDTSIYRGDWQGVAPAVEIVTADFTERNTVACLPLFAEAA